MVATPIWEERLINQALEATRQRATAPLQAAEDPELLKHAYEHCESITAASSRSFHAASRFLPRKKRRAIRALYAFCRVTDDLVDETPVDPQAALDRWRAGVPEAGDVLVANAWAHARVEYDIPIRYAEQLMDGVARDLSPARYRRFEDLADYCYGVASTVGLMSMHIIGYASAEAIGYAVKMGVALQLTNILRDVGEDWRAGRIYLPEEEMKLFGVTHADVEAGVVTDNWREFMHFQLARARQIYREAWPGIGLLNRDGRLAIAAAADLYREILRDIEAHDYDVFRRRAHVSTSRKLMRLPAIWLRSRARFGALHHPHDGR